MAKRTLEYLVKQVGSGITGRNCLKSRSLCQFALGYSDYNKFLRAAAKKPAFKKMLDGKGIDPDNMAALLAIIQQIMDMLAESKTT